MLSQLFTSTQGKPPAPAGELAPFVIHAFIVYRIASFLTFRSGQGLDHHSESGPFNAFDKFRDLIGMTYSERGAAWTSKQPNEIAKVFTCMFCSTTWIGFAVALLSGKGLLYGLALSTAAVMVERYLRG